jgi:hypothetical protein
MVRNRAGLLLLAATALLATFAVAAGSAGASTKLRVFEKSTGFKVLDPSGKPFTPTGPPPVGSVFIGTDLIYVGNHKHHAKRYVGSDHIRCTITSATAGICEGQIALGGSMLLVEGQPIDLAASGTSFTIDGGTGKYAHAKGTIVSKDVGTTDDSDMTITLR